MKYILYLITALFFICTDYSVSAQNNQSNSKQARQIKREQKKKAREVADQKAFQEAVQAIKDKNWVLMATTLFGNRGQVIPVSDNTNFIQFKGDKVYVQLAFTQYAGPNGLGGITVEGTPSNMTCRTNKNGNINYSFMVNGFKLNAQIVINLSAGNNYANATVYPIFNSKNLTFSGILVPTANSGIFRSGFISY